LITQPLEYPSAGSVFRNPPDDFAGRLIEECGLKGYKLGGAMVSLKHANFIVNYNNATAKDVHDLIVYEKEEVKKKFGIELKIEQEFVNWE
jgi:UDP-N-acetylmuramate dehydrogenase